MITDVKIKDTYLITLIGVRQAKEGYAFIHHGPSSLCEDCKYRRVCIESLEVGRIYEVVGIREKIFPCKLHEAGVRVVEVTESGIRAALSHKLAIEGAVIIFQQQECDMQTCKNYEICVPRGLLKGDRCRISEIGEKIVCPKDLLLVIAVLQRLPAS